MTVSFMLAVVTQIGTTGTLEIIAGIDLPSYEGMSSGFHYLQGGPFQGPNDVLVDDLFAESKHAKVGDTIATGYTYQGRLIRPALVELQRMQPAYVAVENTEPVSADLKQQGSQEALEEQALL